MADSNAFEDIASGLASSFGGSALGFLTNQLFGKDPAEEALSMLNTIAPGTTGFERLSAGGAGAAAAGASESLSQKALNAQIANQKAQQDIARRQVDASIENTQRSAEATEYAADRNADRIMAGPFQWYKEHGSDYKGKEQTKRLYFPQLNQDPVKPRTSLENNTPRRQQGILGPHYNPMLSPWMIN